LIYSLIHQFGNAVLNNAIRLVDEALSKCIVTSMFRDIWQTIADVMGITTGLVLVWDNFGNHGVEAKFVDPLGPTTVADGLLDYHCCLAGGACTGSIVLVADDGGCHVGLGLGALTAWHGEHCGRKIYKLEGNHSENQFFPKYTPCCSPVVSVPWLIPMNCFVYSDKPNI
jgi:hypothetical protein